MLRLAICCGGGFSSSFMVKHVKNEIQERHLEDRVSVVFMPFGRFKEDHKDLDIALLCPHLLYDAKNFVKDNDLDIPIYMIPSLMYGTMHLDDIIEDCEELIEMFSKNHENIAHFPDEGFLEMKRNLSHKKWLEKKVALESKTQTK